MVNEWYGVPEERTAVDTGTMFASVPKRQRPQILCGAEDVRTRTICKNGAPCRIHSAHMFQEPKSGPKSKCARCGEGRSAPLHE